MKGRDTMSGKRLMSRGRIHKNVKRMSGGLMDGGMSSRCTAGTSITKNKNLQRKLEREPDGGA